jgi:nucleotide-binding universal stress UspA family protein
MKRILVAVDGSETSHRAAQMAGELAEKFAAQVELVHVMPPPPVFSEPAVILNVAELERAQYEAAQKALERASQLSKRPGVEVETRILAGPAAEVIAEEADKGSFDLVVVGSRGRAMLTSALLGGVSHRLIHLSKKPVLVVH